LNGYLQTEVVEESRIRSAATQIAALTIKSRDEEVMLQDSKNTNTAEPPIFQQRKQASAGLRL
jgi:hypothetical protein